MKFRRVFAAALISAATVACGTPELAKVTLSDAATAAEAGWEGPGAGPMLEPWPEAGPVTPKNPDDDTCAERTYAATLTPVDILISIDASGSMNERIAPTGAATKWTALRDAIEGFIADPRSAGLGVGVQYFPTFEPCTTVRDCAPGALGCTRALACSGGGTADQPLVPCIVNAHCTAPGATCIGLGSCGGSGRPCLAGQTCQEEPGAPATSMRTQRPGLCDFPLDRMRANPTWCAPGRFATPAVAIADLPANAPALARVLDGILPTGQTPMAAALRGALDHLRARAGAPDARRQVLVVSSDGAPTACPPLDLESIARMLSTEYAGTPAITTFAIGVYTPAEQAVLEPGSRKLAEGGGSGTPFIINPGGDLTTRFLAALTQIRETVLPCEYAIPRIDATIDYGRVNVAYGTSPDDTAVLGAVPDEAACHPTKGGWYYDVAPANGMTPTAIRVCERTCRELRASSATRVQLRFGCKTRYIE